MSGSRKIVEEANCDMVVCMQSLASPGDGSAAFRWATLEASCCGLKRPLL